MNHYDPVPWRHQHREVSVVRGTSPITVTHLTGVKFSIDIRGHEVLVDQTINGGGTDSAPTPVELLGAALGSCIAFYVHHFFHARGLPSHGITVSVTQKSACNPNRVESFDVTVGLPSEIPSRYMPLLERVVHSCPAHNTLAPGAEINVVFEAPVAELC
jgi:putative redox protein